MIFKVAGNNLVDNFERNICLDGINQELVVPVKLLDGFDVVGLQNYPYNKIWYILWIAFQSSSCTQYECFHWCLFQDSGCFIGSGRWCCFWFRIRETRIFWPCQGFASQSYTYLKFHLVFYLPFFLRKCQCYHDSNWCEWSRPYLSSSINATLHPNKDLNLDIKL